MSGGRWETRVAIVDSSASEPHPLAHRVESLGLETRSFDTGDEVLDAISLLEIDCVVLDLRDPRCVREEALSRLLETGLAPVVVIHDPRDEELRLRALRAGACACVSDPSDVRALGGAIFGALTGSSRPSAPVRPEPRSSDEIFQTERRLPCLRPTPA
jgi:FixJ family two-component response regulator